MFFKPHTEGGTKPGRSLSKPGFLLPAVEALIIQCLVLTLLYLLLLLVDSAFEWQVSIGIAALMQGALAAVLTHFRRLPAWWLPIQFFFPSALLLGRALDLSPGIFLGAFVALLLVYWTPFKTRVPLYLSGEAVWQKVLELMPVDRPLNFIDIGSGIGGFAIHVAQHRPMAHVTGIELAPVPWLISWVRGRLSKSRARFVVGNYTNLDFSQFDLVFAYLSPAVMDSLWEKALSEMRAGTLLLSYEFLISDVKPDIVITQEMGGSILYGWYIPNISKK